jgi:hypothetical protein
VQAASRNAEVQNEAPRLFEKIIDLKQRFMVEQALVQQKVLLSTLADCFATEIEPLSRKLSGPYREDTFAMGSTAISPAESESRMLRYGSFVPDSVEIRTVHRHNHKIKDFAFQQPTSRLFRKKSFLQTRFGLEVSVAIQTTIDNFISKSMKWQITPAADATHYDPDRFEHSM